MPYLYERLFYAEKVNAIFSNEGTVDAMLGFESALAAAQAKHGIIPSEAAAVIEANCKTGKINIEKLIADSVMGGNLAIPLVSQLTQLVRSESPKAAGYVHFGATSQDLIDSAIMVQIRKASIIMMDDLEHLLGCLVSITKENRATWMVGRSFMQHARPISFGFKTAGWLDPLQRSKLAMQEMVREDLVLQFGGAVGTLFSMEEKGLLLSKSIADSLGLKNPPRPWHTQRDRLASIGSTMGILAGNIGKMAKDISLLAQTEIAELNESSRSGKGGSSAMPQKSNPVGCICILANAVRIPALISTLFSTMSQDHERATGAWHAEWQTLTDIVQLAAGALDKAVELMQGLEINSSQMLHNLELTKGLIYAENISLALTPQ
ncbi:MAG: 3-carboxy-cis,cis-muconate cycloisomerase, partial [Chitinophagales bacterium]